MSVYNTLIVVTSKGLKIVVGFVFETFIIRYWEVKGKESREPSEMRWRGLWKIFTLV